jgi:Tc5 transposase DNA-binding domain/Helix-turn-helix domain
MVKVTTVTVFNFVYCSDRDGIKEKELLFEKKLDIIRSYEKGVTGKGLPAIAKANGISIETLKGWVNKREELEAALLNADVETRKARHLNGGKFPANHTELEEQLHGWILEKNAKGLGVKDHYIQQKALNLLKELHTDVQAEEEFKASTGWLSNF